MVLKAQEAGLDRGQRDELVRGQNLPLDDAEVPAGATSHASLYLRSGVLTLILDKVAVRSQIRFLSIDVRGKSCYASASFGLGETLSTREQLKMR